jgi:hypothetical protein
MSENYSVILTAADHEKNGFVALAQWPNLSEARAREFIAVADEHVSDESEPDIKMAAFTFVLDLMEGPYDCIDNGKRCLPTQVAMSLAPEQVRRWLEERPDPDSVIDRAVPALSQGTGPLTMSDTEQTKLEPCPFCGSNFNISQEPHDNHPVGGMFYIYHEYGPIGSAARKCPIYVDRHFDSREEAIAAWNRRATPSHTALEAAIRRVLKWVEPIAGDNWDAEAAFEEMESVESLKSLIAAQEPVQPETDEGAAK